MRKGKEHRAQGEVFRALKPKESSYIKFNFYTLCEQAQRQSPGRRPKSRAARPRGSADPGQARKGFRMEMVGGKRAKMGAAVQEGSEPPHPPPRLGPAPASSAPREAAAPRARRRTRPSGGARPAPRASGGAGSRLPPHPALCPRAGGERPLGAPTANGGAALTALAPARAASLRDPAAGGPSPAWLHPGGTQPAAVRGRSPFPRSLSRRRPERT